VYLCLEILTGKIKIQEIIKCYAHDHDCCDPIYLLQVWPYILRLSPERVDDRPRVLVCTGPHWQGAVGICAARILATQGVVTCVYACKEELAVCAIEEKLYQLTGQKITRDVRGVLSRTHNSLSLELRITECALGRLVLPTPPTRCFYRPLVDASKLTSSLWMSSLGFLTTASPAPNFSVSRAKIKNKNKVPAQRQRIVLRLWYYICNNLFSFSDCQFFGQFDLVILAVNDHLETQLTVSPFIRYMKNRPVVLVDPPLLPSYPQAFLESGGVDGSRHHQHSNSPVPGRLLILSPTLPLAYPADKSVKLFLVNMGIPVKVFEENDVMYKSPFGDKLILQIFSSKQDCILSNA